MPEITLILHNIRSLHNVGSIFRTAEGLGVEKIILSGYTPYPALFHDNRLPHISEKLTKQIHKTALGAEKLVAFEYHESLNDRLLNNLAPLYALEQSSNSISIAQAKLPSRFSLLLGEEVNGISDSLLAKCDGILEIPMVGQKESFNVSVAAGIALYALTTCGRPELQT